MEAARNPKATPQPAARDGAVIASLVERFRRAAARVGAFADWYSEHCRRIRAYQELTQLDTARLHAVLSDPAQHERILDGLPPSKGDRGT